MPFWRRRRDEDAAPEPAAPEIDPESVPSDWEPDPGDFEDAGAEVDVVVVDETDFDETAPAPALGDIVVSWPPPEAPAPFGGRSTEATADPPALEIDEPPAEVTPSDRL